MASSRKLLILDLNGTLLVRASHAKRKPPLQSPIPLSSPSTHLPRLRSVYGRPYLPSFREYLFHTETKKWLDTMVWSSAQPHSVADMVQHCFAETKEGLLAIWARDTLGLSKQAYNQKTQTTKDLAKPWAAFPMHSAKTTLLLDDSVLKAQLQPWNHLCIPEYVSKMRAKDLETWRYSVANAAHTQPQIQTHIVPNEVHPPTPTPSTAVKAFDSPNDGTSLRTEPFKVTQSNTVHKYDETLLAVIGILNELKDERNVGKWIRTGGLYIKAPPSIEPAIGNYADREGIRVQLGEETNSLSLAGIAEAVSSIADNAASQATASMWFEQGNLVDIWASKGRRVLKELDIDVTTGIKVL